MMNDLQGVLEVIAAYPVHILTFLGCILLLVLVIPKRKRRREREHMSVSPQSSAKKTELTQSERHLLVEKINQNRISSLKKSSAVNENSKLMIVATIILIALTLLFIVGMFIMKFQKY